MTSEDWDEVDEDDDGDDVVPCPSCGAEVYEDADWCPHCRQFLSQSRSAWRGKPAWWIAAGLLGIAAVIWLSLGPLLLGLVGG